MSEMTLESAAQALEASWNEPVAPAADPDPGTSPAVAPSEGDAGTTPAAPAEDSFTDIDPSQFSDAEEYKRRLQADYTRKTQAIAEQRNALQGIDPDRARQSIEFIEALETDPNFVLAVHAQLTEALEASGYTPAQAAAIADAQVEDSLGGDFDEDDGAGSVMQRELAELKAWRDEQENLQWQQAQAGRLQREEMAIRQANPTWNEQDFDSVFELAFAHGGSLDQAARSYKAMQDRLLGEYLERKQSVDPNLAPVPTAGHSVVPPEGFGGDMDAAHKAASEHLRNLLSD